VPLEGRYARLEPLSVAHAAALHAAMAVDDRIWDYLPYGPFEAASYRDWVATAVAKPDPMFFAVMDRGCDAPAGVASLMRITPEMGTIEVGHICLAPALQRTRAASEMLSLLAEWVFDLGYRRFEWKCDALNLPSRRAAQRFGFSFEGVFRQHMVVRGRNRDTAWFAMTDGDWQRGLRAAHRAWLAPENFDAAGNQQRRLGALTGPCRVASDPALERSA
jgi:RimJ/RimL family protein N-acetyltransferase